MKIKENAFVAIDYTLTIDDGTVVDQSREGAPLGFVFGKNMIIPGLEKELEGMEAGEEKSVKVSAAEGYGEVRDELIQELPRKNFPEEMEIDAGMVFQANTPHGPMSFRVAEVKDEVIVADLNHPLAGQDLNFEVRVSEVRESTEEDLMPHACDGSHGCETCSHS